MIGHENLAEDGKAHSAWGCVTCDSHMHQSIHLNENAIPLVKRGGGLGTSDESKNNDCFPLTDKRPLLQCLHPTARDDPREKQYAQAYRDHHFFQWSSRPWRLTEFAIYPPI